MARHWHLLKEAATGVQATGVHRNLSVVFIETSLVALARVHLFFTDTR